MYELRYNDHVAAIVDRDSGEYVYKFSSFEAANSAINDAEQIFVMHKVGFGNNYNKQLYDITPAVKQALNIILATSFPVE